MNLCSETDKCLAGLNEPKIYSTVEYVILRMFFFPDEENYKNLVFETLDLGIGEDRYICPGE
jgi:hypothetical protein